MTNTTSTSFPSSFDPQLLKLLAHHQQSNTKEFLQHAFYYNHPPPNAVATNLPRHFLGNGSSKLNTENSGSTTKYFSHGKIDQQQQQQSSSSSSNDSPMKKTLLQQMKQPTDFDQWLQPPLGSLIQGPPCLQADKSTSSTAADLKSETTLSSGRSFMTTLH